MGILTHKAFGVYSITFHTEHGDMIYIGSTVVSFKHREWSHVNALKRQEHRNQIMQRLWNKYGEFEFAIIEEFHTKENITQREQSYIEQIDKSKLINLSIAFPAPFLGRKHTEETKRKMSQSSHTSDELRAQRSYNASHLSEETKLKRSMAFKGKPIHPNTIAAARLAQIGNKNCVGRVCSEETKEKMRASQQKRRRNKVDNHE